MERKFNQELQTSICCTVQGAKLRSSDWLWSTLGSQMTYSSPVGQPLTLPSWALTLSFLICESGLYWYCKVKEGQRFCVGRGCTVVFLPLGPVPGSPLSFEVLDQQQTVKAPIYVFIAKRQTEETLNPLPTLHFLFQRLIYIFPPFLSSSRVCSLWGPSGLSSTSISTQQALQIPPSCPHYLVSWD